MQRKNNQLQKNDLQSICKHYRFESPSLKANLCPKCIKTVHYWKETFNSYGFEVTLNLRKSLDGTERKME